MKPEEPTLSIGELARRARVNLETVRYYERRRLLPKPARSASGYRRFAPELVQRIRFIKHAQALGFTLKEIHELLSLRVDPNTTCAQVRAKANAKTSEIQQKIRSLEAMKRALDGLAARCSGSGPASRCPILESFAEEEEVL